MTDWLTWQDTTPDDERRMRDLVRLFDEPRTVDDLGIGQIRDTLGDALFPGTSTVHARARYFLLVPWAFLKAARSSEGAGLLDKARKYERQTVTALKSADAVGMIGRDIGADLKTLPSQLYWSALRRYGILRTDRPRGALRRFHPHHPDPDWDVEIPIPQGFPAGISGLELQPEEADWLRERILTATSGTYLSHLITHPAPSDDYAAPWDHPALDTAPELVQRLVHDAELFSLLMHGAQLLYNLMLGEAYAHAVEESSITVPDYPRHFDDWTGRVAADSDRLESWDVERFLGHVGSLNPNLREPTRWFVNDWYAQVVKGGALEPESSAARKLIRDRERLTKGDLSRLTHPQLLQKWRGSSGSGRLLYRWPQVRTLLDDLTTAKGSDARA
ncbi:MAG: DUF6361 family protein [Gordonia sp. (in: high G+C Gram-positive bacteria)]